MSCSNNSIFDSPNTYIKFQGSDLVSVEGANLLDRLLLKNVIIPFKQILKGIIILKPGQSNYLFNFLGLGDNATFVALVPKFDTKSVMEEDNYVNYIYSNNLTNIQSFKEIMILTGNSTHRIPQLYLSNPNTLYSVVVETMVAVIDDKQTFFTDNTNQIGVTYTDLIFSNLQTWEINESIVFFDNKVPQNPLVYLYLNTIDTIEQQGSILIVKDTSSNSTFLQFRTLYDANQSHAAITYIRNNYNAIIGGNYMPIIYFKEKFYEGDYIYLNNSLDHGFYNSSEGLTFSSTAVLDDYYNRILTQNDILNGAILRVFDGINTDITPSPNKIIINGDNSITGITQSGTYSISFDILNSNGFSVNPELKLNLIVY